MSCYNWCSGTIKIPNKEWPAYRKFMIAQHNNWVTSAYDIAVKIHHEIKADSKYKRKYPLYNNVFNAVYNGDLNIPNQYEHLIYRSLLSGSCPELKTKLPKKKDFPKANLKTIHYGYFELDHDNKSITYDVQENNRAVDRASSDPFVIIVFNKLHSLNWTRNSGGQIVGNDEYNRDNTYEGGGANYVLRTFGIKAPARKSTYLF